VYPTLGGRPVNEIRRRDIVELLDHIEDKRGPVMADRTLAIVRKLFNWHAARDEDFRSPIVRGMARTKPKERARDRLLTDDELRAVWTTAEAGEGPFERLVQFLLLTAARRNEASQMRWSEIDGGDWTLPAARNKVGVDLIRPLSATAQNVLAKVHRSADCPYVFTTNGRSPVSGYDYFKRQFDATSGVTDWRLHDLRRTARSLMSRAGVPSDHAERCLGHVIGGVRGVYDRHEYHAEKQRAFEVLAAQIGHIVNPQPNVVPMARR
jgi:integrase